MKSSQTKVSEKKLEAGKMRVRSSRPRPGNSNGKPVAAPDRRLVLARLLVAYRYERRMGVRDLAEKIGVDYVTLHRFEMGRNISSGSWVKIVKWALAEEE